MLRPLAPVIEAGTVHAQDIWHVHFTSVRPMFFLLMTFCRELLRVLVSNRFVDLRIMSSTSVELKCK